MKKLCPLDPVGYAYTHLVGTGGIGSGMFFLLVGSHTLGRNESRPATLLPYRDYCKLHIITHYIAVLLCGHPEHDFHVFPLGKVGDDPTGRLLIGEMQDAGMNTGYVERMEGSSTLFSVCFQYPDSSGGNLTTANSASYRVKPEDMDLFFRHNESLPRGNREIILAVPEVPLETRIRLLEQGRARGSFNISSVLCSEITAFERAGGFEKSDLLALNIDEAAFVGGMPSEINDSTVIVEACIRKLIKVNPRIQLIITDGHRGSYGYKDGNTGFTPVLKTEAVSTAGAGDAFLSGVIAGLVCGLPLLKMHQDPIVLEGPLESAIELGTLLASLSVTSPDTVHQGADAKGLLAYADCMGVSFGKNFSKIFMRSEQA